MMADKSEALETALWAAMVALQEKAALTRRLSTQAPGHGNSDFGARFTEQVESLEQQIATIRQVLQDDKLFGTG
jgi:two-component system, chemotaxis family, protein-glutamate methylesterase/glutaminase